MAFLKIYLLSGQYVFSRQFLPGHCLLLHLLILIFFIKKLWIKIPLQQCSHKLGRSSSAFPLSTLFSCAEVLEESQGSSLLKFCNKTVKEDWGDFPGSAGDYLLSAKLSLPEFTLITKAYKNTLKALQKQYIYCCFCNAPDCDKCQKVK